EGRRCSPDRRRGERGGNSGTSHRKPAAHGPVGLHQKLRGLGGGWSHPGHFLDGPLGGGEVSLLDLVLFLPLAGFLALLLVPKSNPSLSRQASLAISLVVFVISLGLVGASDSAGFHMESNSPWISSPAIRYHIGL